MFHEMPLKLYFMKCSERKISQCILPLKQMCTKNITKKFEIKAPSTNADVYQEYRKEI